VIGALYNSVSIIEQTKENIGNKMKYSCYLRLCVWVGTTLLSVVLFVQEGAAQRGFVGQNDGARPETGRGGFGGGFGMFDALRDKSGNIELSKLPEETPELIAVRIKNADKNGDGLLDSDEQRALTSVGRGGMEQGAAVVAKKMRKALSEEERANLETLRLQMIEQGVAYLAKSQSASGSFSASPRVGIGPTIIDVIGLLRVGTSLDDPTLQKGLAFLEGSIQEDGGIYSEGGRLSSYESCLGLVCFMLANQAGGDGRYDKIVANAESFVRKSQYNESNGVSRDDEYFGGVGYGNDSGTRPDLSNTQFFIEALREIGAEEDDPAIQDALVFVSRCQNLESEDNPIAGQTKTNDGGFIYTFVSGQENPAGQEVSGGLRSYGSITYAGLKSLIYAGLTADDPRVEAATNWIRENYSTMENPGLGKKGLYYYYHTLSKCFQALGESSFEDKNGVLHNWRNELIETLALAENVDGSWVNDDRMWFETDANLVTGYVLIVLSYCASDAE